MSGRVDARPGRRTLDEAAARGRALVGRLFRHPSWAVAHVRNLVEARRAEPGPAPAFDAVPLPAAIARLAGTDDATVERVVATVPEVRLERASALYGTPDASRELVTLLYALCRLLRPRVVLETGVANGYSSAAILHALEANGDGELVSIDLPHLHPRAEESIGAAVPPSLHSRWRLLLGPARAQLSRVVDEGLQVDLFVQDASHSFGGQLAEYTIGWRALRDGGILITDDVGPALAAFARDVGATPFQLEQSKPRPIGILEKR